MGTGCQKSHYLSSGLRRICIFNTDVARNELLYIIMAAEMSDARRRKGKDRGDLVHVCFGGSFIFSPPPASSPPGDSLLLYLDFGADARFLPAPLGRPLGPSPQVT